MQSAGHRPLRLPNLGTSVFTCDGAHNTTACSLLRPRAINKACTPRQTRVVPHAHRHHLSQTLSHSIVVYSSVGGQHAPVAEARAKEDQIERDRHKRQPRAQDQQADVPGVAARE